MNWFHEFCEMMYPVDPKKLNIEGAFLLKQENLPSSIFKYRQVNESSLRNLTEDTIWLSSPKQFNDPYDCSHCADYSKLSHKELYKDISKLPNINELKKHLPQHVFEVVQGSQDQYSELKVQIGLLIEEQYPDQADIIKCFFRDLEQKMFDDLNRNGSERIRDSFKVCSFTTNRDSIIMWSHYANFHQGFCIEYDITQYPYGDFRSRFLYPIIYSDKMVDVTELFEFSIKNESFNNLYYSLAALVKSTEWSYENEWRLVFAHGVFEEDCSYPMAKPKAIYLGSKISPDNQKTIINIATQKGIDLYKMKLEPSTFKLAPVSIDEADQYFFKQQSV